MKASRRDILATVLAAALTAVPGPAIAGPVVTIVHGDGIDPLWLDDGIATRLVAKVAQGAGLTIKIEAMPWLRAIRAVELGEADALLATPTDERQQSLLFAPTVALTIPRATVYRFDNPRRAELEQPDVDLRSFTVALTFSNKLQQSWIPVGTATVQAADMAGQVAMVAKGRADLAVGILEPRAIFYAATIARPGELVVRPDAVLSDWRFGVRRSYPDVEELVARIDRALIALRADGSIERIYSEGIASIIRQARR